MFSEYSKLPCEIIKKICKEHFMMEGLINTVIDGIQQEIIEKQYIVKPIRYRYQVDKCNGKVRKIGIQDVKQQIYDYIAVYAMEELFRKKIGFYQCGALKNKGCKLRKHRNGAANRVNLVSHALFQMDDILIVSKSLKDLKMAVKRFSSYVSDFLGLEIKETSKFIDLSLTYIDILGRKISRRSLTVRSSNFLRFRRTAKKVRKRVHQKKEVPLSLAKSYIGRYGAIKHSNTQRFQQKYHVSEDIKRCKEIVSTHERRLNNYGKDEIYAAAVKCSILSA
jgi:hypothetical protein